MISTDTLQVPFRISLYSMDLSVSIYIYPMCICIPNLHRICKTKICPAKIYLKNFTHIFIFQKEKKNFYNFKNPHEHIHIVNERTPFTLGLQRRWICVMERWGELSRFLNFVNASCIHKNFCSSRECSFSFKKKLIFFLVFHQIILLFAWYVWKWF